MGSKSHGFNRNLLRDLKKACFANLTSAAVGGFSATQTEHFSNDSCSAITGLQIIAFKPEALSGFMSECIGNLSTNTCANVSYTIIVQLHNSFSGFTSDCINNWNVSVINQMNSTQVGWFITSQINGLQPKIVSGLILSVYQNFNETQLRAFNSEVVAMLTVEQIAFPYAMYSKSYLTFYNNISWWDNSILDSIHGIKKMINSQNLTTYLNSTDTELSDPTMVSWLEIASVHNSALESYLSSNEYNGIKKLKPQAVIGIRSEQVSVFNQSSSTIFSLISASQAAYLDGEVLNVMTTPQYQQLTPEAIANLNPQNIQFIPSSIYASLACNQIAAFTSDQISTLPPNYEPYTRRNVQCTFGLFSSSSLLAGFGIATGVSIVLTIIAILIVKNKSSGYDPIKT